MPVPNKTSNDVYYKRQLSFYSFNIHVLSSDDVYFYCYDETVAKKGADNVCSMLYHFINNHISEDVKDLDLFCDGCGGQNKNYTFIRFMHWLVAKTKRFTKIIVRFPVRGHSYLECDRDMSLINQATLVDLPSEWLEVKPSPYNVHACSRDLFFWFWGLFEASIQGDSPYENTTHQRNVF